jgi:hypothetical protein
MMEQLPWLIPLVRSELPRLACHHHTYHPVPRVRSKFAERLNRVDDEVTCLCLCFPAGGVDMCAFAVDHD